MGITDSLVITPQILGLIAEIDEFKGAWAAIGRISPEQLNTLRRVATIESVGSSTRIEGVKLTDKEVEELLSGVKAHRFETRDEQEVAGYAAVMETVFGHWQDIPLTENHIKQLHRDLLYCSVKDERHRGEYKKHNNHVEAFAPDGTSLGVVFETATPFDTPRLMQELVDWFRDSLETKAIHVLIVIAIFVVRFLAIHPFQDGNGRLSRVLTTLLLLRSGYSYVPYGSLESVIEQSKESYYLALRQTQATVDSGQPNWQPWLTFFLRSLQQQKARLEIKLGNEQRMFSALPKLSLDILALCRQHGRVTVAGIVNATGANRNTVKDHIKALKQTGHIKQHGAGRGTWYGMV